MGSPRKPGQLPQFIYALVFCLVATMLVATKPYVYASPPPPLKQHRPKSHNPPPSPLASSSPHFKSPPPTPPSPSPPTPRKQHRPNPVHHLHH
ncbi:hypothetical protein Acr_13g0003140 [Actinidia rufa]|uniref:Uncharacterized protein n=1 Tax=Actinidia rufa TaxID=165716 RepID=A0A7J0FK08_9ERIC|nr:hypothetical protein Acr_13g0003140 [Actinidia rufa]